MSPGVQKIKPSDKTPEPAKKKGGHGASAKVSISKRSKKNSAKSKQAIAVLVAKGRKSPLPVDIKPMLATLVDEPFEDDEWLYEIKWDGYRAVSYLYNGLVEVRSRNNLSFNDKFKTVTAALKAWNVNAVVDGEIIAVDHKGHANFQQLQGFAKKQTEADLVYYIFDLIWYEGKNVTALPLTARKQILESICPADQSIIRYSDHIEGEGKTFFDAALKQGLEGVMAKKWIANT